MILFPHFNSQNIISLFFLPHCQRDSGTTTEEKTKVKTETEPGKARIFHQISHTYVWGLVQDSIFTTFHLLPILIHSHHIIGQLALLLSGSLFLPSFHYISRSLTQPRSGQFQLPFSFSTLSSVKLFPDQFPMKKCLDPDAFGVDGERTNC